MNIKCKKSRLTSGFSLIELMVVIAIVALLTAIAVPSYQGYLQQAKVTEIFSLAADQMNQWTQAYSMGNSTTNITNPSGSLGNVSQANLGTYIHSAVIVPPGGTPPSGCVFTGSITGESTTGGVCITIITPSGIDKSLDGAILTFSPNQSGTATGDTTDTTDTTITWSCSVNTTNTTAISLLSPGNCAGV